MLRYNNIMHSLHEPQSLWLRRLPAPIVWCVVNVVGASIALDPKILEGPTVMHEL